MINRRRRPVKAKIRCHYAGCFNSAVPKTRCNKRALRGARYAAMATPLCHKHLRLDQKQGRMSMEVMIAPITPVEYVTVTLGTSPPLTKAQIAELMRAAQEVFKETGDSDA